MMKIGGIFSEKEAANFLMDKVGKPFALAYVNHLARYDRARMAPHAIVPDLHAFNFPAGKTVNDSCASSTAEAFFEVKTMTACPTRYKHNNEFVAPADRRARAVTGEYARKFKKLDEIYARAAVGENGEGVGPFEAAQQQCLKGQVIPLCTGCRQGL